LKTIFKPSNMTKGEHYKSTGQPTLAWGAMSLVQFQLTLRLIWYLDLKSINTTAPGNKLFVNSRVNLDDYLVSFGGELNKTVEEGATVYTADVIKLDSSHDAFSRALWVEHQVRNGLNVEAGRAIIQRMVNNNVQVDGCRFKMADQLATGGLITFSMNTMVCAMGFCYVMDACSDIVAGQTGDDGIFAAVGAAVNDVRMAEWEKFSKIRFLMNIDEASDYCGLLHAFGTFVPNFHRLFNRLIGYRARNWEHFLDYQKSMCESIKRIRHLGVERVLAAMIFNRKRWGVGDKLHVISETEAYGMWDFYVRWSTANKATFYKYMRKFVWTPQILSASGTFAEGYCVEGMWGDDGPPDNTILNF